jgi:hypothetical protein
MQEAYLDLQKYESNARILSTKDKCRKEVQTRDTNDPQRFDESTSAENQYHYRHDIALG